MSNFELGHMRLNRVYIAVIVMCNTQGNIRYNYPFGYPGNCSPEEHNVIMSF